MSLRTVVKLCMLAAALAPFPAAGVRGASPNDDFADALVLSGETGRAIGSNADGTLEAREPRHAGETGGKSSWWTWRPSSDGLATIYTFGSSFDTILGVYTGSSPGTLTEVASNDDMSDEAFLSLVTFDAEAGEEYRIAVDGFEGASGRIVLLWHLNSRPGEPPPNDAFDSALPLEIDAGRIFATNHGATVETGEPPHGSGAAGRTVWWRWVPSAGGMATINTSGSSFDTKLAVYAGESLASLTPLAADDDAGESLSSQVIFQVAEGADLRIAVDGSDAPSSVIQLAWSLAPPCDGPDAPAHPGPADASDRVPTQVQLEWDRPPRALPLVVYGPDDRREIYEADDPRIEEAWSSTVAIVRSAQLVDRGDGTYALPARTLGEAYSLCLGERFADQPNPAFCSGFLAAPDLVVTSASCISNESDCSLVSFVFGFRMRGPGDPVLVIPVSQVYRCVGLEGARQSDDAASWAVVRLDRPVTDRAPLRIRRKGKVADQQTLYSIGHPGGLPAKLALGGRVRENRPPAYFLTNLDAWVESAGSAVFNADTREVEGILAGGEEDLEDLGECYATRSCADAGCSGEPAARITELSHLIPSRPDTFVYRVYLGPCGRLQLAGETREPSWEPDPLEPGTRYCWQVIAVDECGETAGPFWSFRTDGAGDVFFRRGDTLDDGILNVTDAIAVLNWLFLGGEPPSCRSSADVDDSGIVDLTDPIALLRYLFLGGTEPFPPFQECGPDPTPDELGCEASSTCTSI